LSASSHQYVAAHDIGAGKEHMKNRSRSTQRGQRTRRASKAASPATSAVQPKRLARALQALASGLPNPWDESTDFFHEFTAAMPANTTLDAESFRTALTIGSRYEIDLSQADQTLTDLGNAEDDWGKDTADGFRQLGVVMRATLTGLSLAFARGKGVVRVRVWLFGRMADGTIVGLRSTSTET
jgi:hypothetical protein